MGSKTYRNAGRKKKPSSEKRRQIPARCHPIFLDGLAWLGVFEGLSQGKCIEKHLQPIIEAAQKKAGIR